MSSAPSSSPSSSSSTDPSSYDVSLIAFSSAYPETMHFLGMTITHSNLQESISAYFRSLNQKFELSSLAGVRDVFAAVSSLRATYGVVPIENSECGSFRSVYEQLAATGLFIVGEFALSLNVDVNKLKSNNNNNNNNESTNTSSSPPPSSSSSSSSDDTNNMSGPDNLEWLATRFVVISRLPFSSSPLNPTGAPLSTLSVSSHASLKSSAVLSLRHAPGSIFRVMSCFAMRDINVLKFEGRPIPAQAISGGYGKRNANSRRSGSRPLSGRSSNGRNTPKLSNADATTTTTVANNNTTNKTSIINTNTTTTTNNNNNTNSNNNLTTLPRTKEHSLMSVGSANDLSHLIQSENSITGEKTVVLALPPHWRYIFVVEWEPSQNEEINNKLLENLKEYCVGFYYLGTYVQNLHSISQDGSPSAAVSLHGKESTYWTNAAKDLTETMSY